MQSLINASQSSRTEQNMVKASDGGFIPFYSEKPSMAPLGTQPHKITPYIALTNTTIAGNSLTVQYPKGSGFLYDSSMELNIKNYTSSVKDVNANVSFNMVRDVTYTSSGNQILLIAGRTLLVRMKKMNNEKFRIWCETYAKALDKTTEAPVANFGTATAGINFKTYLPCIESFLTEPEKLLLLDAIDNLEMTITFNTAAMGGFANDMTMENAYLYCYSYKPEFSVYEKMVTNDWSKPFKMTMINTNLEPVPPTTVTSLDNYTFTTPYLCLKTHIFVQSIVTTSVGGAPRFPIESVSLIVDGVPYYTNWPTSRVNSNAARHGSSKVGLSSINVKDAVNASTDTRTLLCFDDDREILTIDWGILCGYDINSGAFFGQALRGTSVSITFPTVTNVGYVNCYIAHEYFQEVGYEPGPSGRGTLSVTSNK